MFKELNTDYIFLIKIFIVLCFLFEFLPQCSYSQNTKPDWENPSVFERNQEAPHASLIPYKSEDNAIHSRKDKSPYFQSLNGIWKFKWVKNPHSVPSDYYKSQFNVANWDTISVPSSWQMKGYGDPKFRNIHLSFKNDPPNVPANYNPVGCYVKYVEIPNGWQKKPVFLHFEGVRSAFYLWVNGKKVGYNQGSYEPSEFNIAQYLKEGKNKIAVEVLRFSDGTFIENQDMWRMSGIFRDVYLFSPPQVHMRDYYAVTDLDSDYRDADLKLSIDLRNYSTQLRQGYEIEASLYDPDFKKVFSSDVSQKRVMLSGNKDLKIHYSKKVKNPLKWSSEKPNLYTLILKLKDKNGSVIETYAPKIGFREIEIRNEAIYVNGQPVKLNGVNSHMYDPKYGQAVPIETMRKDLVLMKKFNINAVRTSHYPPPTEYLKLADKLGIYIIDETNDECHSHPYLSKDPKWRDAFVDRARKMVTRDRNHPSIIMWSAGNEAGVGNNLKAVIETGKKLDPSRPGWMYGGNHFLIPFEDVIGPRYWTPLKMRQLAKHQIGEGTDHKPSFMDEYLAATGNGLGGLDEYWNLIYRYPRLTGGAIWDWMSPGMNMPIVKTPDESDFHNDAYIMGRAEIAKGWKGNGLKLNGEDNWLETYRDRSLNISGKKITLDFRVKPVKISNSNILLSKGSHQFEIKIDKKDSLQFSISGKRDLSSPFAFLRGESGVIVSYKLPSGWYGKWHRITGIYDGKVASLWVDGDKKASHAFDQSIKNTPYPLCFGRNPELQTQGEYSGRLSSGTFDDIRVFAKALSMDKLQTQSANTLDEDAVLSLNFEEVDTTGTFFSTGLGGRTYGMVWPNRIPQPELWQVKKSTQPVDLQALNLSEKKFLAINRQRFTNIDELAAKWEVVADDSVLENGTLNLDVAPRDSSEISIPFGEPEIKPGTEYWLNVSFSLKQGTEWAPKGYEVAWNQFKLPYHKALTERPKRDKAIPVVKKQGENVVITGDNFKYVFDRTFGAFSSMRYKNIELIKKGPTFNVWRPALANDSDPWGAFGFPQEYTTPGLGAGIYNQWLTIGINNLNKNVLSTKVDSSNGKIVLKTHVLAYTSSEQSAFENNITYFISANGKVEEKVKMIPHGKMPVYLPKIGLKLEMPKEFDNVEWYGRGPFETYPDRKTGAKIGIYKSTTEHEYVPYLLPQEYGNKTDVRWVSLTNNKGVGFLVKGDSTINFSARNYSDDNLERAVYPFQLHPANFTTLNIDHKVSGVGGTANKTLIQYKIYPRKTEFRIYLQPYDHNKNQPRDLYRRDY